MKMSWSLEQVWNESLEDREERKMEKRDHIWASEIGGAMVDRYLKMNAVEPTNPPNARSLRKFEAGNVFEWIVNLVLKRAGILISTQDWIEVAMDGLPRVTGKLDHLAGGKPDWEIKERELISWANDMDLPPILSKLAKNTIKYFKEKYPNGLKTIILETKSVGSLMFDRYEAIGIPNLHHALQITHYLLGRNDKEGHIIYISKDDLRVVELGVMNPSRYKDIYIEDIKRLGEYLKAKEQPPLEKEIEFKMEEKKFSANWKVMYSQYLTKLYGYENQHQFETKYRPIVAQWNRVVGRILKGDNMTALNKSVIQDIKKTFPNFDELIDQVKKLKLKKEGE